jgi:hypothetical protein
VVSLGGFDPQVETAAMLPDDFSADRGAVVFEKLGSDALVVVMNPYDSRLRRDVEQMAKCKCHFYIALPSEFDAALESNREILLDQLDAGS